MWCARSFLQLPPVPPKLSDATAGLRDAPSGRQLDEPPYRLRECGAKPAFQSVCWREAQLEIVELRTIHR